MDHPDHALWRRGWRENQTPFHLPHVHPLLVRFWSRLGLEAGERVFVPLCGKSLDLLWLREGGHDVVGVELSPVAVKAFYKSARLQPTREDHGELTRWSRDGVTIYCGDFFRLVQQDLAGVRAVYDRAALTALPEELREHYVAHLHAILPAEASIFLITVEDLDDIEEAADNMASSAEIVSLYAEYFGVELLHAEFHPAAYGNSGEELEGRCVHKVYRFSRQSRIARPAASRSERPAAAASPIILPRPT